MGKEKMKILICTWRLTHGGAERVASLWAQGFVKQGFQVDFLLGSHSSPITYEIPEECNIYYECRVHDAIAARIIPRFIKRMHIRAAIKKSKPDVIICVTSGFALKVKKELKKVRDIPLVITEHNSYERPEYAPMPDNQYKRKFVTNNLLAKAVTVLTQADKNYLKEKKGEGFVKNTFVLPNPTTYSPLNTKHPKSKIILAAGRLDAWHVKGFDLLIGAWASIASKYPDWTLNIAGDGNVDFLKNLAKEKKVVDRVCFLGFVDMLEQYKKSSIFVLSSRYEGFGMVLTEAMSQGCACIACDYKGRQKEIIQNASQGIICPVDDEKSLADAMEKMIVDESYRESCQKNAIERSKFYALSNIMNLWNEILEKVNVL